MAHPGAWWGLPDFGVTEKLQSVFRPGSAMSAQGGSSLSSRGYAYPGPSSGQVQPIQQQRSNVLGQNTVAAVTTPQNAEYFGAYGGGGGGGGGGQPSQPPLENAPQWQEPSYDLGPAMGALDQAEQALQSSYEAQLASSTTSAQQQKQSEQEFLTSAEGQTQAQKESAERGVQTDTASARRQASQLLQGIQARFGKSTGTGGFASEILGSQAMQNIGMIQGAFRDTIGKLDLQINETRRQTAQRISSIQQQADNSKLQLRAWFDQARAEIAGKRGELQSRKSELIMEALQNYQQLLQQVEARNTSFKQQLYQSQLSFEQSASRARDAAIAKSNKLTQEVEERTKQQAIENSRAIAGMKDSVSPQMQQAAESDLARLMGYQYTSSPAAEEEDNPADRMKKTLGK